MSEGINAAAIFGENVFNETVMKERLPRGAYQRLKDEPVKEVSEEDLAKKKVSVRSTLLVFALMIVCVGIMKIVGFIISGMIMMLGMCILLTPHYQKRNYVAYVVFSAVISFLSYFLFKNVLYVSLPRGFLPF